MDVWEILEGGYTFPTTIPIDTIGKKDYETNAKGVTILLRSLSKSEFAKIFSKRIT